MKENPDMDTYASDERIDELLNSFIDGELTQRQFTEVQRLVAHNEQVARRMSELQKCKMLVSSLPCAEAPAGMADEIKSTLERRTLLGQNLELYEERRGARHLLFRNVLSAAAMIGLIAVLAAVIYTILAPEGVPEKPVAAEGWKPPTKEIEFGNGVPSVAKEIEVKVAEPAIVVAAEKTTAESGVPQMAVAKSMEFSVRLELKTGGSLAVAAYINRAIEDNGLFEKETAGYQSDKGKYALNCSREAMGLLLADLENVWGRFDSARLFVETGQAGGEVVVGGVSVEQIEEIINEEGIENQIKIAKDFAVLNNMNELLPGREVFAAIEDKRSSLLTIPKPVLTSSAKTLKKGADEVEDGERVYLTIVILDDE